MSVVIFAISLVVLATIFGAFGAVYMKRGSADFSFNILQQLKNKNLLIGVALYLIATAISLPAYRYAEVSLLYPFVSLGYIFIAILSVIILKEKMNTLKWLGIIFILLGVTLVGFGGV